MRQRKFHQSALNKRLFDKRRRAQRYSCHCSLKWFEWISITLNFLYPQSNCWNVTKNHNETRSIIRVMVNETFCIYVSQKDIYISVYYFALECITEALISLDFTFKDLIVNYNSVKIIILQLIRINSTRILISLLLYLHFLSSYFKRMK